MKCLTPRGEKLLILKCKYSIGNRFEKGNLKGLCPMNQIRLLA